MFHLADKAQANAVTKAGGLMILPTHQLTVIPDQETRGYGYQSTRALTTWDKLFTTHNMLIFLLPRKRRLQKYTEMIISHITVTISTEALWANKKGKDNRTRKIWLTTQDHLKNRRNKQLQFSVCLLTGRTHV